MASKRVLALGALALTTSLLLTGCGSSSWDPTIAPTLSATAPHTFLAKIAAGEKTYRLIVVPTNTTYFQADPLADISDPAVRQQYAAYNVQLQDSRGAVLFSEESVTYYQALYLMKKLRGVALTTPSVAADIPAQPSAAALVKTLKANSVTDAQAQHAFQKALGINPDGSKITSDSPKVTGGYPVIGADALMTDIRLSGNRAITLYLLPDVQPVNPAEAPKNIPLAHGTYVADLRDQNNKQIATAKLTKEHASYLAAHLAFNNLGVKAYGWAPGSLRTYADIAAVVAAFKKYSTVTDVPVYDYIDGSKNQMRIGLLSGVPAATTPDLNRRRSTLYHTLLVQQRIIVGGLPNADVEPKMSFENGIYVTVTGKNRRNYVIEGFDPQDNFKCRFDSATNKTTYGKIK